MLKKRVAFILFLVYSNIYALQIKDSIFYSSIKQLKSYNINVSIPKFKNDTLNKLFRYQILYKSQGIVNDSLVFKDNLRNIKGRTGIVANYVYGDYLINKKTLKDSLAFYHYKQALKSAEKINDTLLVNECLHRICESLYANNKDLNLFKQYIDKYQIWANDNVDLFWIQYYQIAHKLLSHLEVNKERNTLNMEELPFDKSFKFASNSSYLKGTLHQLKGIYFDVFTTDYLSAEKEFKQAITYYDKEPYYYSQLEIYGNKVNLGIVLYNQNKVSESINVFKEALHNESNYYTANNKMFIVNWLNKAYKKINNVDSAYVYSELYTKLKDSLDKYAHSIAMKKIEEESVVEEKEDKINELKNNNANLSQSLNTVLPFLGFTVLALILSFYLYKRYKKKSNVLEEEQSETLQKLDELKNIVIKNHIVLKDKTKVYISDLLYIKSEDHYLNIFLTEGKNHFVRGKLSQIKKELPPNFIQCHRSYIVNSNFVKQVNSTSLVLINKERIPLSRSYKDKF